MRFPIFFLYCFRQCAGLVRLRPPVESRRRLQLDALPRRELLGAAALSTVGTLSNAAASTSEEAARPFRVELDVQLDESDSGMVVIEVVPEWAPLAATRFRELIELGFYKETRFHRVIPGYIAQFGISVDPRLNKEWLCRTCKRLSDEPIRVSNKKGTLSFANAGKDTRQTQVFVNLNDNGSLPNFLDNMGFVPFAKVVQGMAIVQRIYGGYGILEAASGGLAGGVSQGKAAVYGKEYLETFPKLSYIRSAVVLPE